MSKNKKKHCVKKIEKNSEIENILKEQLAQYKKEARNDKIAGIVDVAAATFFGSLSIYELAQLCKDFEFSQNTVLLVLALFYLGVTTYFGFQAKKDFGSMKENNINAKITEVQLEAEMESNKNL